MIQVALLLLLGLGAGLVLAELLCRPPGPRAEPVCNGPTLVPAEDDVAADPGPPPWVPAARMALVAPVLGPSQQSMVALRAFDFAQAHGVLLRWDSRWPGRVVLWGTHDDLKHVVHELTRVGFLSVLPTLAEA